MLQCNIFTADFDQTLFVVHWYVFLWPATPLARVFYCSSARPRALTRTVHIRGYRIFGVFESRGENRRPPRGSGVGCGVPVFLTPRCAFARVQATPTLELARETYSVLEFAAWL